MLTSKVALSPTRPRSAIVTAVSPAARLSLQATVLTLAACGDIDLPPQVAASEYIVYRTDVDASVICMDDRLAREDRFIERTAALLGLDPPGEPIDFVWSPVRSSDEAWACDGADSCYTTIYRTGEDRDFVVSQDISHHHELVHAVAIRALGHAHPVLDEGLAEYLGSLRQRLVGDSYPAQFKELFADSASPPNYGPAMPFVGSLFARHGAARYLALRAAMPRDAGLDRFAEIFAAEYGQSLDDALAEMRGELVRGIDLFDGCGDGEAPELAWTDDRSIDLTLDSACGDPWFYGAGFVDGHPGFYGRYTVEIPTAGHYELTVGPADGPAPLSGLLTACSFDMIESAAGSFSGSTAQALLRPGRHSLAIQYPPQQTARATASVRLEYIAPP